MTNQEYLAAVATALGPIVDEVVFTGGLVVQEYWTVPALREPRATVDADVIVEAATYMEYAAFGKRLGERGFLQPADVGTPPYRWIKDDLVLDAVPQTLRPSVLRTSGTSPESSTRLRCPSTIPCRSGFWMRLIS